MNENEAKGVDWKLESVALEWVSKENPDCDSAEHWFYMQAKAFRAGANWQKDRFNTEQATPLENK